MSNLVRELLSKRGITLEEEVERFLHPRYEEDTHSPFLLQNIDQAVARVLNAIENNERIAIYADFDCDGIPGAALLSDFFKKIKYDNVEVYIPHRDREGYGFHLEAIDELSESGVQLIITVDVGTNAVAAVLHAKEKGIDCIVTDHHEILGELPACIVLNPKFPSTSSGQVAYPFPDLCGAAVAFKLVQAMLGEGKKRTIESFAKITDGWEKWLLDLVAIATVADLVPLVGENRVLAHYGLRVLRKSPRMGLVALCNRLRLRKSELTEDDIGFSIAPRINAASRMDEPEFAFRLLTTHDREEAEKIAAHLEELNARRKGVVSGIVRQAKKIVRERFRPEEKIVAFGNPEWKPALLGLAANSIMEARGGLVCLWGRDAEGRLKGSCRSDGSISVVDLFTSARDAFVEFGGHEKSGGFSVSHDRVHTLHESLAAAGEKLAGDAREIEVRSHDAIIALSEITRPLLEEVSTLAPFGIGNPKPLFSIAALTVSSVKRFGKDQNHLEVVVSCARTGISMRAFDFFRSPEDFTAAPQIGNRARLLASVERDTFRGGLALRLADVLPDARILS